MHVKILEMVNPRDLAGNVEEQDLSLFSKGPLNLLCDLKQKEPCWLLLLLCPGQAYRDDLIVFVVFVMLITEVSGCALLPEL